MIGTNRFPAITMRRRAMHVSHPSIGAVDALTFPPLPRDADRADLHVTEGGSEWGVTFNLALAQANATPLAVEVARGGIVARATAYARYKDDLIFELEVAAPLQIRQVGALIPMRRVLGEQSRPITLEIEHGARLEESSRLFSFDPQQPAPGQPHVNRFVVAFDASGTDVRRATLVIPFVELNDFEPSATADLRELPLDVALAEHRFRVVAVEPQGPDEQKVVIELPSSTAAPRFVQPARLLGSDPRFGWERHAVDAKLPGRDAIWMATKVGDPPIVTFKGAVMRVDGPLRLEMPLI